jgi:hypothetical protein
MPGTAHCKGGNHTEDQGLTSSEKDQILYWALAISAARAGLKFQNIGFWQLDGYAISQVIQLFISNR